MRQDAMLAILADLLRRIDGLANQRGHLSVPRLQDELDQIRHIARAFHVDDVESLAGTLQSALCLHGLGPVILSYLDLMRDAIVADMPVVGPAVGMPPPMVFQPQRATGAALRA